METIRKGSRGEAVKKLQKLLGITEDGIFGKVTEARVKVFQEENGLVVDGIVGPKTWAQLCPSPPLSPEGDNGSLENQIVLSPLSKHISPRTSHKIEWICIHYTAGASSKAGRALATKRAFEGDRDASADFCVDDETMVQFNPDPRNYYCWAVGGSKYRFTNGGKFYGRCKNSNSISIEICSTLAAGTSSKKVNHEGWSFSEAVLENAARLTRMLMAKYNIDIDHVIRHYDVTGKVCPGIIGWNEAPLNTTSPNPSQGGGQVNSTSCKWEEWKKKLVDTL